VRRYLSVKVRFCLTQQSQLVRDVLGSIPYLSYVLENLFPKEGSA